jgi:hypothetical protein
MWNPCRLTELLRTPASPCKNCGLLQSQLEEAAVCLPLVVHRAICSDSRDLSRQAAHTLYGNDLKAALDAERAAVADLKSQLASANDEAKRQREARHLAVAGVCVGGSVSFPSLTVAGCMCRIHAQSTSTSGVVNVGISGAWKQHAKFGVPCGCATWCERSVR